MAGLKKPEKCDCGSTILHREWQPEKWCCENGHIVISRNSKPQTGICIKCGRKKSDQVLFKPGKNSCMDCYNQYMKDWNIINKEVISKKKSEYYIKNKKYIRERSNAYWQSGWEQYLSDRFHGTQKSAKRRFDGRVRDLEITIDREFLFELIKKQNYKCAITDITMIHNWGDMRSASIDRIDSSRGYTPDNVQLVCKFVNLGKSDHSQSEVLEFFSRLRELWCGGVVV